MALNKLLPVVVSMLCVLPVHSDTLPLKGKSFLDEMARIDAEMSLFRKQQELASLKGASVPQEIKDKPKVVSIYGVGGRLVADIRYSNGLVISASAGEEIPGGYRVVALGKNGVTVTEDGKRKIGLEYYLPYSSVSEAPSVAMPQTVQPPFGASFIPQLPVPGNGPVQSMGMAQGR